MRSRDGEVLFVESIIYLPGENCSRYIHIYIRPPTPDKSSSGSGIINLTPWSLRFSRLPLISQTRNASFGWWLRLTQRPVLLYIYTHVYVYIYYEKRAKKEMIQECGGKIKRRRKRDLLLYICSRAWRPIRTLRFSFFKVRTRADARREAIYIHP